MKKYLIVTIFCIKNLNLSLTGQQSGSLNKRHFTILIFAIALLPQILFAQKVGKPRIDSLMKRLSATRQDTSRCGVLMELARVYKDRNPTKTFDYVSKVMVLSKKLHYSKGIIFSYIYYGFVYQNRFENELAIQNFQKSLEYCQKTNDTSRIISSLISIASHYEKVGKFEQANKTFSTILSSSYKSKNLPLFKNALHNLNIISNQNKDFKGQLILLNSSLKQVHGNSLFEGYIYSALGETYLNLKASKQVLKNYQLAANLLNNSNDYDAHAYVLEKFAEYYLSTADTSSYFEFQQKSAALYAVHKNEKEINVYDAVAKIYIQQKKYDQALKYFQKALEISKKNNADKEYIIDNYIAELYSAQHNENLSVSYYKKAIQIAHQSEDYITEAKIIENFATYYQLQNNRSEETKYFTKAAALYGELKMLSNQINAIHQISLLDIKAKDYGDALATMQKQQDVSKGISDKMLRANIYTNIAELYFKIGEYDVAIKNDILAEQILNTLQPSVARDLEYNISSTYDLMGNHNEAVKYGLKMLSLSDKDDISHQGLAAIMLTNEYYQLKQYNLAMDYVQRTAKINGEVLKPWIYGSLGPIIRDAPDSVLLKEGFDPAKRYELALKYLEEGEKMLPAEEKDANSQKDFLHEISLTYEKLKNYGKAYDAYKQYTVLKDSIAAKDDHLNFVRKQSQFSYNMQADSIRYQQQITNQLLKQQTLLATQQKQSLLINSQQLSLANHEKDFQHLNFLKTQSDLQANSNRLKASQKEEALAQATLKLQSTEIQSRRTQSRYLMAGFSALVLASFFVTTNYVNQRKSNRLLSQANMQISSEKERSDSLLLNILPADVAEELKEKGSASARSFDEVTVLFTDFVNFTSVSERLAPQELVDELHYCFKAFDEIMTTHQIEKIKTIGDAYLAVAGLPNANKSHAENAVKAAIEIMDFIQKRRLEMADKTFDIRIGIHSGSVVAGIVGLKKFAYDIWGDTVNTAARMEQNSESGKINVSDKTYNLVKDKFAFTYRGEIEAKNKGALKMYFVS